jgi:LacI family transcriptional regulator
MKKAQKPRSRAPSKRTTLEDVATAAGVSVMTVSNVINGKHTGAVGSATLRRVEREIRRLKYRPHEIARTLRLARSSTIGMIIVHESRLFMASPFVALMVTGLTNSLTERGYSLIVQGVQPRDFVNAAVLRRVSNDGIVAHISGSDRERTGFQKLLKTTSTPIVIVQDHQLIKLPDCCVINQEDEVGGRLLAELVIKGGARKLIYFKPRPDWPGVVGRERGIRAVVAAHGAVSLALVTTDDEGFAASQRSLRQYFDRHGMPDAILSSNDHLAIAAMKLVQSMGLRVPEDIAITGFNDFEYRKYADPQITTVRSNAYEMGFQAGMQMVNRLTEGRFANTDIVLPVSLVPGGSTR